MPVNLDLDDILDAEPVRPAGHGTQSLNDIVAQLLDRASSRLDVPRGKERNLAVRTHRLHGVQVALVEHRYPNDVFRPQEERGSVWRQGLLWRHGCERRRDRRWLSDLIFQPDIQIRLVDGILSGCAAGENKNQREKVSQRLEAHALTYFPSGEILIDMHSEPRMKSADDRMA